MNRHRNMQMITKKAMADMEYEDDGYDDDYDDYNGGGGGNQGGGGGGYDDFEDKVDQIFDIVGEHYSYDFICDVLEDNGLDVERAIDHILNPPEEGQSINKVQSKPKKDKADKKKNKKKKKKGKKNQLNNSNNGNNQNQNQGQKNDSNKKKNNSPNKGYSKVEFPTMGLKRKESNVSQTSESSGKGLKRKNSKKYEEVKRKLSINNQKISKKESKKFGDLFNGKIYGNEKYPEIKYKYNTKLLTKKRDRVTVVITGHVDSGKSTLLGHIMVLMKQVDKNTLRKLEMMTKNTKHNKFAWIFDEREDERERGITVDVNEKYVYIGNKFITFLDTPGHRDLVPKMISGACQCQFAMLIVDGVKDSFMSGFNREGQTKEHAYLLNSIGLTKLVVCVNKMDLADWKYESFEYVRKKVLNFFSAENLNNFGEVEFVPVSALTGENISERVKNPKASWWSGGCLFDSLKTFTSNVDDLVTKPFRMLIQAAYESKEHGKKGFLVTGRIDGGVIKKGDKLEIKPIGMNVQIKDVYIGDQRVETGVAGDIVELIVTLKKDKDWLNIRSGLTLSSKKYSVPVTSKFLATINTFDIDNPLLRGSRVNFHIGPLVEGGLIKKLKEVLDRDSRKTIKKNPRFLVSKMTAKVEIHLDRPMCLELDMNFQGMGLFQFRDRGRTLGDGKITRLL